MPEPEELPRERLVALLAERDARITRQAERIAAQDEQIATMAARVAELVEVNETLAAKLARLEHLLSRNSGNSSSPPSRDDDPGRTPPGKKKRQDGAGRKRGKQPGAPGSHLAAVNPVEWYTFGGPFEV